VPLGITAVPSAFFPIIVAEAGSGVKAGMGREQGNHIIFPSWHGAFLQRFTFLQGRTSFARLFPMDALRLAQIFYKLQVRFRFG
jgi:hypothetical protein